MTPPIPTKFEATFRTNEESGGEELSPPSGLCLTSEGNILLTDDFNHRIQVYDPQFNLLFSFGEKGKEQGQLQYPKGITVDKDGNIFVADSWNHRIQKFNSKGIPLLSFGTCGDGLGELNEPYDILIDPSGVLIVVERYNHRIQFFDKDGKSLGWVGQRGTTLEENLADLYETPFNLLASPLFEFPTSIAVDSCGNYFVTDSGNHRIRKFNNNWQEILTFGNQGDQNGQFQYPLCISISQNDLLYIADLNNNRIQIYTAFGQFLDAIENADIPLEAPCLTLVDTSGNLFVGSTFDTKILKYQISMEPEIILAEKLATCEPPQAEYVYFYSLVQEKNNNEAKSLAALEQTLGLLTANSNSSHLDAPIRLSQLAFAGKEITKTSIDLALPLIENQFIESRNKMITTFHTWQTLAQKFNEILTKEQQLIQKDPQGLHDFNKELYISEQEDKNCYRETRNTFYSFRKNAQQLYNFICRLIESDIPEDQLEPLKDLLSRQWKTTTDIIKKYFNEKEKCEESMVQILGNSGNDQLPTFLIQYHHNVRTLDLLMHLQFQLRAHCQVLNILARQAKDNEKTRQFLHDLISQSDFSENATRIMIHFHENWQTLDGLELFFLDTLDSTQPYREDKEAITLEPNIEDFSPVAFDSENLDMTEASRVLQSQGAEIKFKDGILSWGSTKFKIDSLAEKPNELTSQCFKTLEAQTIFEQKYEELLNQLEDLGRQRRDLDDQLRQVGTNDKATPIGINNNIAIMDFQLNLLRRMIKGIDINENLNLYRLVSGAAIARTLNSSKENSKLLDDIASYFKKLDNNIVNISRERKIKNFELVPLREQQKQLSSVNDISGIDSSIKVETNITEIHAILERLELEFKRNTKAKSLISKILNYSDYNPSVPETKLKEAFSISKVGSEIGLPFNPQGLTHNSKGELLVPDYEQHQIHCFSPEGKYKFHFGTWGNTAEKFKYPVNLAADSQDNIYVIDEGNGVVKKFDSSGNFILQFEDGILGHVFSLSVDSKDQIHIADPENNRIVIFDTNGKEILHSFSAEQSKNLNHPCGIHCLNDGGTIIGDQSEFLLKKFDAEGKLVHKINREGLGFDDIYFLTSDLKYGIFGSDFWNSQIIHLNNNLERVDVYRQQGNRIGELGKTGGLSIHQGRLAASNFHGRKVQLFDLPN